MIREGLAENFRGFLETCSLAELAALLEGLHEALGRRGFTAAAAALAEAAAELEARS